MALTSGFFNSFNGDRKYNAEQMSTLFNGIINDGVFANIGNVFAVTATTGFTVNIDTGRAWFNGAWINNDEIYPVLLDPPEVVLDRIDAIVIEVNHTQSVRNGLFKAVKGAPAESASVAPPTMTDTEDVHQYPIAFIARPANSTSIVQSNIQNKVGTSDCPYITGILEVHNIDNIIAQWQAQWNEWYAQATADADTETSEWLGQMKSEIETWFEGLQDMLDGDVAASLAQQIVELQDKLETLAKEKALYDVIADSAGDNIQDSSGNEIIGRIVFGEDNRGGSDISIFDPDGDGMVDISKTAESLQQTHYYYDGNNDGGYSSLLEAVIANGAKSEGISYFVAKTSNWEDIPQFYGVIDVQPPYEFWYMILNFSGNGNYVVLAGPKENPSNPTAGSPKNPIFTRRIVNNAWKDSQWSSTNDWAGLDLVGEYDKAGQLTYYLGMYGEGTGSYIAPDKMVVGKANNAQQWNGMGVIIDPATNSRGAFFVPFSGAGNRDGARKYYAAVMADTATNATNANYANSAGSARASNISMSYNGNLWISYS